MKNATMLRTGMIGSVVTALCCFTPVLIILLGAVGLSTWLGWIDYVLFPMLGAFVALTAYGWWRKHRAAACCATDARNSGEAA